MVKQVTVAIALVAGLYACSKEVDTGTATTDFPGFMQPANFPAPVYKLENNPVNRAAFELGRRLFYDARLSRNNTISCGSCHIQSAGFTQHGHSVSHGVDDRLGTRNSPPIMNLAWSRFIMWDGAVLDLDLQPILPITNHEEMDESLANVLSKLKSSSDYPGLFSKAFGSSDITTARTMKALSQFMLLCISANSKYDKVKRKEGVVFTAEEQDGYRLVQEKCSGCHAEPLFTDNLFRNNGIAPSLIDDKGRYNITLSDTDRYRFKTPSLRNLQYTAPYMHDGRFLTLDAVLDHYSLQVQPTSNLDPLLQQNGIRGIPLTTAERGKILAFLQTLNDREFITNQLLAEQ
jgi:cytochrome c peroxidase